MKGWDRRGRGLYTACMSSGYQLNVWGSGRSWRWNITAPGGEIKKEGEAHCRTKAAGAADLAHRALLNTKG